ncbi:MAG: hypothetical protein RIT14_577, partial [Pseudomonadota bacterium]
ARHTTPDPWIAEIFSAKAVQRGGVIRRNVNWVAREIGHDRFCHEVRRRGFRLLRAGPQYVILCSPDPVQILF